MTGYARNVAQKINVLLEHFPVVTILGARQAGKTTLTKQLRPNWHYIDLEKPSDQSQFLHDPEFFFSRFPQDLIIDEAQELPVVFNVLRGVIDANRSKKGRFIITGSSSPELLANISETLAGRVAIVELGTCKANELCNQPLSPFYDLFDETLNKNFLFPTWPLLTREQIHFAWLKGGYPEPLMSHDEIFYQSWMENYQSTYLYRDIARLFPKLNKHAFQRFLIMLGKLSGTIINKAEIARSIEMSEPTIKEYLSIAEGTFLWRQLKSYENNITKSIVKMPKGHIQDSGLLHYLLRIDSLENLYSDPIVGHSFESFVIEEIIKGLQAKLISNWDAYYYRTRNGAEIDLILEGPFGVLPIEIKYGTTVNYRQLRALEDFVKEHHLPFGLLINQSEQAQWLSSHIYQLPVGMI